MNEFEQQVWQIEAEMQAERIQHDGISAEDAYADRLGILSLTEGEVQDGDKIVQALLVRCTLWIEIIREKYEYIECLPLSR